MTEASFPRSGRSRLGEVALWTVAGVLTLSVHAGAAYYLMQEPPVPEADGGPPAAIMIELAALPEAAPGKGVTGFVRKPLGPCILSAHSSLGLLLRPCISFRGCLLLLLALRVRQCQRAPQPGARSRSSILQEVHHEISSAARPCGRPPH